MTISTRLWIIYFFLIATTSMHAMQKETNPNLPKYSLVGEIKPTFAVGKITFIKQLWDKTIIFFDNRSKGELFDSSYTQINHMYGPETWCVYNVCKILDDDNNLLIIAQGGTKMALYNETHHGFLQKKDLLMNQKNPFSLWQRSDFSLFIRPYRQDVEINIFPNFEDSLSSLCKTENIAKAVESSYSRDEGTIVPAVWLQGEIISHFSDDMFDLNREQNHFSNTITCYHQTRDGLLFLGHNSAVTIWRLS